MTRTLELLLGDRTTFTVFSTPANTTKTYQRFSDAADDVVDVRIYQGIHFRSADEVGRRQGTRAADWTVSLSCVILNREVTRTDSFIAVPRGFGRHVVLDLLFVGIRSRGIRRGARKRELVSGEYLFWQADLLAEGLQPRIAAQQSGMFTVHTEQEPAHPDGANLSHVVQNFEGAILIAQTRE